MLMERRFGIELAPEVVQADGNVQNLAWRICNAKKVLVSIFHGNVWSTLLIPHRRLIACRAVMAGIRLL